MCCKPEGFVKNKQTKKALIFYGRWNALIFFSHKIQDSFPQNVLSPFPARKCMISFFSDTKHAIISVTLQSQPECQENILFGSRTQMSVF